MSATHFHDTFQRQYFSVISCIKQNAITDVVIIHFTYGFTYGPKGTTHTQNAAKSH